MSDIYKPSKWMGTIQQDQLIKLFFKDSPIRVDWDMKNTQRISEDGKQLILGAWAGPEQCIIHLIHEMAHLVEINDARILRYGWGLTTPEVYIPGRYSHMASVPVSWQPTQREVRVIAMQWQIQNYLGIRMTPRESLSSLIYMSDWSNVPCFRYNEGTINEYDEARYNLLEYHMINYINYKYTLSYFKEEWARKNELLRQVLIK